MSCLYTLSLHILILNIYLYILYYTYTYTYFYCHMHEQVKLYPYSIIAKTTPPAVQFEDDFLAAYIASAISSGTGRHSIVLCVYNMVYIALYRSVVFISP